MGYRPGIDNYVITDPKLSLIKEIFYRKFEMKVKYVFQIRKGRKVHRVNLEDGTNLRLDIYSNIKVPKKEFLYQKLAYEKGVHVAKIIDIFKVENKTWKVSEWIEGIRIADVWNSLKMFEKCGEQIAKLNLVKDVESGNYLGLSDFNKINLIWSKKEEVYIIDFFVWSRLVVDESVVNTIRRGGFRTKNKVDAFLKGYKKFRSVDKIIEIIEEEIERGTFNFENEISEDI